MRNAEVHSRPVTVVVLARNAEATIGHTVRAIGEQQVCRVGSGYDVSVRVVVNGTTDHTADAARRAWDELSQQPGTAARLHVHELERAGKANAWNAAVHQCTSGTPDAFIFCDADIRFERPDTFALLLGALDANTHATVATPEPRKSFRGVRSRIVRALASRGVGGGYTDDAIAGGCYAMRGSFARSM